MTAATGRYEFAPPPTPGLLRALALALLAHGALVAMLTVGVQWKHTAAPISIEAELWSAIPQEAAPPAPEPVEQPVPEPTPVPVLPPTPPKPVAPPEPPAPDPQIAIAKEKARIKKEKLLKEEKLEQEKLAKLELEKLQKEKLQKEKLQKEKLEREKEIKLTDAAKQKALKNKEEDKKLADQRKKNLDRMAGLAANPASGGPSGNGDARSTGSAAQSSGPSAGYGGKIRAKIKPNITFTDTIPGNPTAEVEVRTSPDGTIISRKLTQSSGVKSWDEAVLNAIDKTEVLPRDTDGRVPSSLVISFRPRD